MGENRNPGTDSEGRCLNCSAVLQGRFCHECGQKAAGILLPLATLLKDASQDVFGIDSRFYRTLVMLIKKPGFLTLEYVKGHRTRYITPIRLYLIMSFLFFLLTSLSNHSIVVVSEGNQPAVAPIVLGGNDTKEEKNQDEIETTPTEESSAAEDGLDFRIERSSPTYWGLRSAKLEKAVMEDPEGVRSAFMGKFRNSFIFLIPIFALMLKILYIRKTIYYTQHFIFAIHLHCFGFFLSSIGVLIDIIANTPGWFSQLTLPFVLIYGFISLRKNYGEGRIITAIKMLMIVIGYFAVAVAVALASLALLVSSL